jgi:hypothetical protein
MATDVFPEIPKSWMLECVKSTAALNVNLSLALNKYVQLTNFHLGSMLYWIVDTNVPFKLLRYLEVKSPLLSE